MTRYELATGLVILAGLVPAGYFAVTFRPRRPTMATLDAGGLFAVIAALYLWAGVRLVLGNTVEPDSPAAGVVSLGLGLLIDAFLWLRAVHWRRFRIESRAKPYSGPDRRRQ